MSFEIRYIPDDDNENEVYICRESMPSSYESFLDVFHRFLAGCGNGELIRDDKDCSCNGDCLDDMITIPVRIVDYRGFVLNDGYGKCDSEIKNYIDYLEELVKSFEQSAQEQDDRVEKLEEENEKLRNELKTGYALIRSLESE